MNAKIEHINQKAGYICINNFRMTTKAIREKLLNYISSADEKKVKAIYTLLEGEISPYNEEWDTELEVEMVKRSENFKNGTAKTYTWEETKKAAIEKHQAKVK